MLHIGMKIRPSQHVIAWYTVGNLFNIFMKSTQLTAWMNVGHTCMHVFVKYIVKDIFSVHSHALASVSYTHLTLPTIYSV